MSTLRVTLREPFDYPHEAGAIRYGAGTQVLPEHIAEAARSAGKLEGEIVPSSPKRSRRAK